MLRGLLVLQCLLAALGKGTDSHWRHGTALYLQQEQLPCPSCRWAASILFLTVVTPLPFGVVRGVHVSFVLAADLSSYTPKHSVKFSEWQEQKYEEMPAKGPLLKEADSQGNQVMVRLHSTFWLCPGLLSVCTVGGTGSAFSRTHLWAVAHLPGW